MGGDAARLIAVERLEAADAGAAATLAACHLSEAWSAASLGAMLERGQALGWKIGSPRLDAFLVARIAADEAEILTLVVAEAARRQGYARALLAEALAHFRTYGVARAFLELRASNHAAQAVYAQAGFIPNGRRRGYYATLSGREDAVTMALSLRERVG